MTDKRLIVDYLCKSDDLENLALEENQSCRVNLLIEIAFNIGVTEDEILTAESKSELCDIINRKIVELDIISGLTECRKNIAMIQLKSLQSPDPTVIKVEYEQLEDWYAKVANQADQMIENKNLHKMVEVRNQIKGSCDTFKKGLLDKIEKASPQQKKSRRKSWFGNLFKSKAAPSEITFRLN